MKTKIITHIGDLPIRKGVKEITYWRNPTEYEIQFGNGANHYRDFEIEECITSNGEVKKWFIARHDGLRYYR
jgi:hypothetical protein